MVTWRELLKPDRRRVLAMLLMLALLAATYIQSYAFVDDVPGTTAPPLYEALRPFDFWVAGMLLIMPLALITMPLQRLGMPVMSSPLVWPLQMGYLYLVACLLVFGHDRWAQSLHRRWRVLIVAVPVVLVVVLWLPGMLWAMRSVPQMISFFLSSALLSGCVLALYVYMTACLALGMVRRVRG